MTVVNLSAITDAIDAALDGITEHLRGQYGQDFDETRERLAGLQGVLRAAKAYIEEECPPLSNGNGRSFDVTL